MKKLGKLSACLLTLCLLTGCNNSTIESDIESESEQETAKEETWLDAIDESTEISSSSIFELYQKEWKITCTIKEQDEALWNVESVIYIDWRRA